MNFHNNQKIFVFSFTYPNMVYYVTAKLRPKNYVKFCHGNYVWKFDLSDNNVYGLAEHRSRNFTVGEPVLFFLFNSVAMATNLFHILYLNIHNTPSKY